MQSFTNQHNHFRVFGRETEVLHPANADTSTGATDVFLMTDD